MQNTVQCFHAGSSMVGAADAPATVIGLLASEQAQSGSIVANPTADAMPNFMESHLVANVSMPTRASVAGSAADPAVKSTAKLRSQRASRAHTTPAEPPMGVAATAGVTPPAVAQNKRKGRGSQIAKAKILPRRQILRKQLQEPAAAATSAAAPSPAAAATPTAAVTAAAAAAAAAAATLTATAVAPAPATATGGVQHRSSCLGSSLVGRRVQVWWSKDNLFYPGFIKSFDASQVG